MMMDSGLPDSIKEELIKRSKIKQRDYKSISPVSIPPSGLIHLTAIIHKLG